MHEQFKVTHISEAEIRPATRELPTRDAERYGTKPISLIEVTEYIQRKIELTKKFNPAEQYNTKRGVRNLLIPGKDYGELPSFGAQSAHEIIATLPEGARVLDVGCGAAKLEQGIRSEVNARISLYGVDLHRQQGQEALDGFALADIQSDRLMSAPFDVIVSSALMYHLEDPWGAFMNMSGLLKKGGILMASTFARVISNDKWSDDFRPENKDGTFNTLCAAAVDDFSYFRGKSIRDVSGGLVCPAEVIQILNDQNEGKFVLEYHTASIENPGARDNGGSVSAQVFSDNGLLDLSCLFYATSEERHRRNEEKKRSLTYIIARNSEEATMLRQQGYFSVSDRILGDISQQESSVSVG